MKLTRNIRISPLETHVTISFSSRFSHSSRSGTQSCNITPATSRPILKGRRRTNDSFETPGPYFRELHTTKIKSCDSPHQWGGKCCTFEGAQHSLTSEGGKHNVTTNTTTANHIITLNTKFSSQTKNPCQTCGNTTNTTCYGATQCWITA
jgi:hypothetical protein